MGPRLSRLEQLTLQSFVRWGHSFHLWLYDELETPIPHGVIVCDAAEILPRTRIFRKRARDHETGVGEGSISPFTDLFRYKLLYERGGVWSDMDITCLRPFDFEADYVFRSHQLGMVGNLMKCPAGCELMKLCYEQSDTIANEDVPWHAQIRILNSNVQRLGLTPYIRDDISNLDSWNNSVRPFFEQYTPIPDGWYAIHWLNEFMQTLNRDGGHYRGRMVSQVSVDKDNPPAGSTLHELYRLYGLVDPRAPYSPAGPVTPNADVQEDILAGELRPAAGRLNILLPSLARGGLQRIVAETARALSERTNLAICIYVLTRVPQRLAVEPQRNLVVKFLEHLPLDQALRKIALEVACSETPVLYAPLIEIEQLRSLIALGVETVPVVHAAGGKENDASRAYNHPSVPYVMATSAAVAGRLRKAGCTRPVVPVRHEIQRFFAPEKLARARREIRDAYGIDPDTLLVGTAGKFEAAKCYTRAVRVLAQLKRIRKTKLMVLGDWTDSDGRHSAYDGACRLALDLDVMPDLIMPGNVDMIEGYYAAFDVYLNTSLEEGASIAVMEAVRAGCPIVAADVGDNRFIVSGDAVLVEDSADTAAYVDGVLQQVQRLERLLPPVPVEPEIVPQLWTLLARFASRQPFAQPAAVGTLFVIQGLDIGGPGRSLSLLLSQLPADLKTALCVIDGISVDPWRAAIAKAHVPILDLSASSSLGETAESLLQWFDQLKMRSICFWNVQPELKLLLAKILRDRDVRLIDVSPGPMLFDELESAQEFQRRLVFTGDDYFERLDDFVSLYANGISGAAFGPRRVSVLPLGTALPPRFVPLPQPDELLPADWDPELAIGTCCRIVPDKRIEFLLDMMISVHERLPGASLTIVGGPDARTVEYLESLRARVRAEKLAHIRFVGPRENVTPLLSQFRVFVMVSDRQGCPNASLEAMAMGLPVVANPNGGTAEQVVDGATGYLAETPIAMADAVVDLLKNKKRRRKFGEAGRARAIDNFSAEAMVARYAALLRGETKDSDVAHTSAPKRKGTRRRRLS
jgi:glycosyltransferase involved in cell wall biosynthesis